MPFLSLLAFMAMRDESHTSFASFLLHLPISIPLPAVLLDTIIDSISKTRKPLQQLNNKIQMSSIFWPNSPLDSLPPLFNFHNHHLILSDCHWSDLLLLQAVHGLDSTRSGQVATQPRVFLSGLGWVSTGWQRTRYADGLGWFQEGWVRCRLKSPEVVLRRTQQLSTTRQPRSPGHELCCTVTQQVTKSELHTLVMPYSRPSQIVCWSIDSRGLYARDAHTYVLWGHCRELETA
jgi:hypothetical protein